MTPCASRSARSFFRHLSGFARRPRRRCCPPARQPLARPRAALLVDDRSRTVPTRSAPVPPTLVVNRGRRSTGVLNHSASTVTITKLDIGVRIGSTGTYNLSGTGVLSVAKPSEWNTSEPAAAPASSTRAAAPTRSAAAKTSAISGNGTYTQSGGTHTINGRLNLGAETISGTYILTAGTLSAVNENLGGNSGRRHLYPERRHQHD